MIRNSSASMPALVMMEFTEGWNFDNFVLGMSTPAEVKRPVTIEEQERLK